MRLFLFVLTLVATNNLTGYAQGSGPLDAEDGFESIRLSDPDATRQTRALYANLKKLSSEHILFGHQDDLAYGVNWRDGSSAIRSDINDVCGQFPSVFGWDLGKLGTTEYNIDTVYFKNIRKWIIDAYKMGSVNTISWHVDNFVTLGDSWDVGENVVAAILPGGAKHEDYKARLDLMADFFKSLYTGVLFKRHVPVVFRPFHEHTGGWFWWGQPHCSPEEYKALWKFTVEYLRDVGDVHNVLYCYSPDIFIDRAHYLECYPGDEYVDILGFDDYHDVNPLNDPSELTRRLRILVELADEKDKIAALTETGLEAIPEDNWWTDRLLHYITADPVARKIAWVLVWRNARPSHHYAPYPGHSSAPNFLEFCQNPIIMMSDQTPKLYKVNQRGTTNKKQALKP
jgi:mannan endo-1,4-beta-mannosidase